MSYDLAGKRVWVTGHRGMVGSAVVRRLAREDCEVLAVGRDEVDLRDQAAVRRWMADARPQAVFHAAGTVGGVVANDTYPVDFLYDNMMIAANVIHAAGELDVEKLLFLGSSCVYPKLAPQPIPEGALLTSPLEPTNEWYAVAKIAGIKLCQAYRKQFGRDFISAMPTNLYGPGDNFDLNTSHVVPALMRKAHDAKMAGADHIVVWGSGAPLREFLHVDDCADALVFILKSWSAPSLINVGSEAEISIADLARLICRVVGFEGEVVQDPSKPDGSPRKLMSGETLRNLGWNPSTPLERGLREAYGWFLAQDQVRGVAVGARLAPARKLLADL